MVSTLYLCWVIFWVLSPLPGNVPAAAKKGTTESRVAWSLAGLSLSEYDGNDAERLPGSDYANLAATP